jgi:hypothetical protein
VSPIGRGIARCGGLALVTVLLFGCGATERHSVTVAGTLQLSARGAVGVAGVVVATPSSGPRITAVAGPNGRFAMRLVPGVYRFIGRSPAFDASNGNCVARLPVSVTAKAVSGVNVECPIR